MVKQIGVSNVSSIKGQSYQIEPISMGVKDASGFHETKASIMARLGYGKSNMVSKLDTMKKHGISGGSLVGGTLVGGTLVGGKMLASHQQNRVLEDIEAMRNRRKVIPFTGGIASPFLNFSSGLSTKTADKQQMLDPAMGRAIIATNTGFNRY